MNRVQFNWERRPSHPAADALRTTICSCLERLDCGPSEVHVLVTDDGRIRELNRDFLGQDRPLFIKAYAMLLLRKIVTMEPALGREACLVLEKCIPYFGRDYLLRKAKELIKYINMI